MTPLRRVAVCAALFLCLAVFSSAQQATRSELLAQSQRTAAPQFLLADAANKAVRLSDFKGKPVVLNFWATECGGCKIELPTILALSRTHGKGLAVVGVSMDIAYSELKSAAVGWSQVKKFLQTRPLEYPILLDDGSAEKAFKLTALPATYLIDRSGRIAASYLGVVDPDNIETNVKALLIER